MKKILFSVFVLCFSLQMKSQFAVGGQLGYYIHPAIDISYLNFGVHAEIPIKDGDYYIRPSFNIGGDKKDINLYAYSLSNGVSPASIDVPSTVALRMMALSLDGKRYFGGHDFSEGGGYVYGGLGLTFLSASYKPGSFDAQNYYVAETQTAKVSVVQSFIRLGIGYDYAVADNALIFGEAGLAVPPGTYNSRDGNPDAALSGYVGLTLGFKYVLGN
jgi:hypothetical protein